MKSRVSGEVLAVSPATASDRFGQMVEGSEWMSNTCRCHVVPEVTLHVLADVDALGSFTASPPGSRAARERQSRRPRAVRHPEGTGELLFRRP